MQNRPLPDPIGLGMEKAAELLATGDTALIEDERASHVRIREWLEDQERLSSEDLTTHVAHANVVALMLSRRTDHETDEPVRTA